MAVTVTSQLTTLDSCEATGTWTVHNRSGAAGALAAIQTSDEEVPPREGTYCLGFDLDIENGGYYFPITSADYTSKMIYIWAFALNAAALDSLANGGVYIIARDTSANYGYWYVGGYDNYTGGWKCFVADLSRSPNANSGTAPNLANCDGVGIGFNNTAKSKATHNMFFDFMREADSGDGLLVKTTSSTVATWDNVYAGDEAAAIGVIRKEGGVYFVQGPITFGDTAGGDCEFADSDQLIVFENSDVPAGHYAITVEGTAAGAISFDLGTTVGGKGISGCIFKTATSGTEPYTFTASDTDIDSLTLYGCTFIGAGAITLPANTTYREVLGCTFSGCGQIDPNTIDFTENFIVASSAGSTGALLLDSSGTTYMDTLAFISGGTGHAIYITATGTYGLTDFTYSGYGSDGTSDAAVYNNSGGSVTLAINGGDTPTVRNGSGASTTIQNAVTVRVEGMTEGTACKCLSNETVGTLTKGDTIFAKLADSDGVAEITDFNYEGAFGTGLEVLIRTSQHGLPNAAIQDDNSSYTDYTTEANSTTVNDMVLYPASPVATQDSFLFGHSEQFSRLKIELTTVGVGGFGITWEYWNGSSWASLSGVTDGTSNFTLSGEKIVSWTIPGNWAKTTINSQGPFYYVRARYTSGTMSTVPLGRKCQLDVTFYLTAEIVRTVTSDGLTTTADHVLDTIAKFSPDD